MDFLQFLPASMLPNVAAAVRSFGEPPALSKPKKEKISGTLASIAVRSMDNGVGIITYTIAKAWAIGNHDCIPRLAQELQIEVDSLKNVQRANREYIQGVLKAMGTQEVTWLKDHKKADVFIKRPIAADGHDSISRLATAVNGIWEPMTEKERSLTEFRDLFPAAPQSWEAKARQRRDEYQQKMKNGSSDFNQFGRFLDGMIELAAAVPEQHKMTAASAFWHVCHVQKSGTASMVFHMWMPQIKERLAQSSHKLTIVGTNYGDFAPPKVKGKVEKLPSLHSCFEGITLELTIIESEQYPGRLAVRCGSRHFGLLASDSWKPSIGSSINATLHNQPGSVIALVTTAEVDF